MDAAELQRIKGLIAKAERLRKEISDLKEICDVGKTAASVRLDFDSFGVWYRVANGSTLNRGCCGDVLEDLAEKLRQALLDVVIVRLGEREKQLADLHV